MPGPISGVIVLVTGGAKAGPISSSAHETEEEVVEIRTASKRALAAAGSKFFNCVMIDPPE